MKQEIHQFCLEKLGKTILQLEKSIQDIQTAANEETKSSAGDKYETGRAMMQQEKDKLMARLETNLTQRNQLQQLKPDRPSAQAELGSLVQTNEGYFYLATALGKVVWEGHKCFVISMGSPLAQALLNRKKDDSFSFQGRKIQILDIK